MTKWITPEEMTIKRERKKKVITFLSSILAIAIGVIVTISSNGL